MSTALNKTHYDAKYSRLDAERLVQSVGDAREFLAKRTPVDTSWHGFYSGNLAERIAGKRVLEIGSGDGQNTLVMAQLAREVVAVDISIESARLVAHAARIAGLRNVTALSGDFLLLDLGAEPFDFVVGKALLHHLTHELEEQFIGRAARLLAGGGEARFFEPAANSPLLEWLRWNTPVPGRPARWQKSFARWKESDPHPDRDNSERHYREVALRHFREFKSVPVGTIERFCRLMPSGALRTKYRRWAHRVETSLPDWLRHRAARSQLLVYCHPL